jgi:hypothetical protein
MRTFGALKWTVAISIILVAETLFAAQDSQPPTADNPSAADQKSSPWLVVPIASSSPKLGTSVGGMAAYAHKFDAASRISLFGLNFQYTSTDSIVAALFTRASFHSDRHRVTAIAAFGRIKNDYSDYLGTGQPLQTNDDLKAVAGRYLYRVSGNWFVGAQANAANYQVLGETSQDDAILETLGVRGFDSAGIGAALLHDSRDNEDMPTHGWYGNINNVAYREGLGGSASYDAYRIDTRAFWSLGTRSVFAVRQFNWLTNGAPTTGQATVVLRGYKLGQYLAPYMSSIEGEERWAFNRRWGATAFAGIATLYGISTTTANLRNGYPTWGGGIHFVIKPDKHLLVNLEYADGVEDNRGVYLKFGYGW